MGIELCATDDPKMFEVFDVYGSVGSVWYWERDEDDNREGWVALMRHGDGYSGRWESEPCPTIAEAVREAWTMYG